MWYLIGGLVVIALLWLVLQALVAAIEACDPYSDD